MRALFTAAALTLLLAGAASAQGDDSAGKAGAPEGPPPAPPRIFQAAGYSQPDITPGLCKTVNDHAIQCVIPEMTVGRYLIQASGTSTMLTADAAQQLSIYVGDTGCGAATYRGTTANPPKVGAAKTLKFSCVTTVITDRPLTITVTYADEHATKDPKGPTLSIRKVPWGGVVSAAGFVPAQGQ
jgi:hypothetical protein